MKPLDQCILYTFVDIAFLHDRSLEKVVCQLAEGGSDLIQLRAKTSSIEEIRVFAERMLPHLETAGIGLVINDHPELAAQLGAPFCHLGQEDFFDAGFEH